MRWPDTRAFPDVRYAIKKSDLMHGAAAQRNAGLHTHHDVFASSHRCGHSICPQKVAKGSKVTLLVFRVLDCWIYD